MRLDAQSRDEQLVKRPSWPSQSSVQSALGLTSSSVQGLWGRDRCGLSVEACLKRDSASSFRSHISWRLTLGQEVDRQMVSVDDY